MVIDLATLSLSKGTRRPLLFITVSSLNWTLSKVVKRSFLSHAQTLLLLIAVPSSVGLESTTEVSFLYKMDKA